LSVGFGDSHLESDTDNTQHLEIVLFSSPFNLWLEGGWSAVAALDGENGTRRHYH
jgi:hypothetical protein